MTVRSNSMRPYRMVLSRMQGSTEIVTLVVGGVGAERVAADMRNAPISDTIIDECLGEFGDGMYDWERRRFSDALNLMRMTTYPQAAAPKVDDRQIRKSLDSVLNHVPQLAAREREYVEHDVGPDYLTDYRKEGVQILETLVSAAQRAADLLGPQRDEWRTAPWHADAYLLASLLRQIGARQAKRVRFSNGNDPGPALAVLQRALAAAGVGHFSADAIVKAIGRKQKQRRTGVKVDDVATLGHDE